MTEIGELQIHTVFSAEEGARLGLRIRALGGLNVVVALIWLYVVWQPAFVFIQRSLALSELNLAASAMNGGKPGEKADLADLAMLLNSPASKKGKSDATAGRSKAVKDAEAQDQAAAAGKPAPDPGAAERGAVVERAKWILRTGSASWLAVATFVGAFLLIAGASAVTNFSADARRAGKLVLPISFVALVALLWYGWKEYHLYESIMPVWMKPAAGVLLILMAASIGTIVNRRGLRLQRAGAVMVILSAVFTVFVIWAAIRWGQMPHEGVDWRFYGKAFAIQSGYGWFLLLAMIGLK